MRGRPIGFISLPARLMITITAIVGMVGFTIGATVIVQDWYRSRGVLEEKAILLSRSIALAAPEAILQSDNWSLYKNLRKLASHSMGGMRDARILSGMVLDPDGGILAHLDPAEHPIGTRLAPRTAVDKEILENALKATGASIVYRGRFLDEAFVESVVPVYSDQKKIGIVRLRLSTAELYTQARHSAMTILAITSVLVVAGSLFGVVIARRMVGPLSALAIGMKSIGKGDFSDLPSIDTKRADEIGQLARSFKEMTGELEEKKRLERELAVNEKLIALGRISAGVAHEVNNPLAGILNCLDTLKKHPGNRQLIDRYLPIIETGLNRIRLIVAGLLGELRIEDTHDLAGPECLNDLRDLAIVEIADKPIHLEWENRLVDGVMVNRQRIQQVVLNLLKNAFQAVPEHGTVSFRAFQDGDCLIFEVEDNGSGISEEDRSRLFDPFFTTRPDGTGLGLWITYRLVNSMNGSIEVQSAPDQGTTVQVFLPAGKQCTISPAKLAS